jgi:hypothetical protein
MRRKIRRQLVMRCLANLVVTHQSEEGDTKPADHCIEASIEASIECKRRRGIWSQRRLTSPTPEDINNIVCIFELGEAGKCQRRTRKKLSTGAKRKSNESMQESD